MISILSSLSLEFILETIAVLTALIYVVLAAKGNYWCFLFGLISSTIYLYICFLYQLYFDVGINLFYIFMSIYGWFNWKSHSELGQLSISRTNGKTIFYLIILGLSLNLFLAEFASRYSNASLPYLDAFTSIFSIIGTYLVIQRKIENWLFWIVIDIVATGMYFYKELYLTSALFLIYTVIAIIGYFNWKKQLYLD